MKFTHHNPMPKRGAAVASFANQSDGFVRQRDLVENHGGGRGAVNKDNQENMPPSKSVGAIAKSRGGYDLVNN